MAVVIASGAGVSVGANTKTSDQVSGQFENIGAGKITLVALPSATAHNCNLSVGGVSLCNDQEVPFFGTTGSMSVADNVLVSQQVNGGKVELTFRETAGTASTTVDYLLLFEPSR